MQYNPYIVRQHLVQVTLSPAGEPTTLQSSQIDLSYCYTKCWLYIQWWSLSTILVLNSKSLYMCEGLSENNAACNPVLQCYFISLVSLFAGVALTVKKSKETLFICHRCWCWPVADCYHCSFNAHLHTCTIATNPSEKVPLRTALRVVPTNSSSPSTSAMVRTAPYFSGICTNGHINQHSFCCLNVT